MKEVRIPAEALKGLCLELLSCNGVRSDVAYHVAEGLVQASVRGVDSHGVRLLPHYLRALDAGRLNPSPEYHFEHTAASTGRLDGDHTFGHAAGAAGMEHAIELARENGIGAVTVYNSSHFGAAAYFSLMAAQQSMIGISSTHADALMLSHGGKRPFFGGYVNRCVNDIRRRPSQPLIQWRFHPHTVHRDRRLRSTQGPSDA